MIFMGVAQTEHGTNMSRFQSNLWGTADLTQSAKSELISKNWLVLLQTNETLTDSLY